MRAAFVAALVALAGPVLAGPPQWTWEAGKQTNNGAITIKSVNGGTTYSGTQNPTGAVAKTNQNAVTQPPTVIIQATGGSLPFNYRDDCWIIDLVAQPNQWFIGAGKVDTATSKFTGIMGWAMGGSGYGAGGQAVMTALLGAGSGGSAAYNPYWCGSAASCAWYYGYGSGYNGGYVVGAAALPILTYKKCYP